MIKLDSSLPNFRINVIDLVISIRRTNGEKRITSKDERRDGESIRNLDGISLNFW